MRPDPRKPLYRRVNTRTWGVRHGSGSKAKYERGTKSGPQSSMHTGKRQGLDYTPLFRFLLSRVGQDWDAVHSEAVSRLDRAEPIFWLVALDRSEGKQVVRYGESSYWSGLFVDAHNRLQRVDPDLGPEHLYPQCACCTHTLNGAVVPHVYAENPDAPLIRKTPPEASS